MIVTGCVYGAALNFRGVLESLDGALHLDPYKAPPIAPVLYIKPANTFLRDGDPIPCPASTPHLRMGGTLGLVIGRTARNIVERDAMDYVQGYTVVNDVSIPHAFYFRPAIRERCRDGFLPIGPFVERDAIRDPSMLEVRIFLNGELAARNTFANLVRPIPRLIADIAEFLTLHPGDLVLAGEPENAPLAAPGDFAWIEIDGAGCIGNPVIPEDRAPEEGITA